MRNECDPIAGTSACHRRRSARARARSVRASRRAAPLAASSTRRPLALDGRCAPRSSCPSRNFAGRAPPARRFALAASVVLALFIGGGFWLWCRNRRSRAKSSNTCRHEPGSWGAQRRAVRLRARRVLQKAGVQFDTLDARGVRHALPVSRPACAAPRRADREGPMTVMLLAHREGFRHARNFPRGYRGVLLPAGEGSIAVLMRDGAVPDARGDAGRQRGSL